MAQAVGPWYFRVEARVRNQASHCAISGGQIGAGTGFIRVLHFCPVRIVPPVVHTLFFTTEAVIR